MIKKLPFRNHENLKPAVIHTTHRIKCGATKKSERSFPIAVNGFFLVQDNATKGGNVYCEEGRTSIIGDFPIDFSAMKSLGYSEDNVRRGISLQRDCTSEFLPQQLEFVLLENMHKDPNGVWVFDSMHKAIYESHNPDLSKIKGISNDFLNVKTPGLWCVGDGEIASRKCANGTKKIISCVPKGTNEMPETWCPVSCAGACKPHIGLRVMLVKRDEQNRIAPLVRMHNVSFRIDTSSVSALERIRTELSQAAEKTNGMLAGIEGVLSIRLQKMNLPNNGGKGLVPQIHFDLNRFQLAAREDSIRNNKMIEFVPQQTQLLTSEIVVENAPEARPSPIAQINAEPQVEEKKDREIKHPKPGPDTEEEHQLVLEIDEIAREIDPQNPDVHIEDAILSVAKKSMSIEDFFIARKNPARHEKAMNLLRQVKEKLEEIELQKRTALDAEMKQILESPDESPESDMFDGDE